MSAPEPQEIYERTRREGQRRLSRPLLELASTAFVAGVDVVFGLVAYAATIAAATPHLGADLARLLGSLAFGISFVFIVVGRSELFTENFLVPIAGLEQNRRSRFKLAELWLVSPILNVLGATTLILVLTAHGVLPYGCGTAFRELVAHYDTLSARTAFLSAVGAGALITLMTWLVEGSESMWIRVVSGWIGGTLLALATLDHVIIDTVAWIFSLRYGGTAGVGDLVQNFFVAAGGNFVGGVAFVTLTRFGQARVGSGTPASD